MRVLLTNHTAIISGAEVCALELLRARPTDIEFAVACPEGSLARRIRALGFETFAVPPVEGSLRLDYRHTPRAVSALIRAATEIRRIAKRVEIDLVHANSTRSALAASLATRLGGAPNLAFVHDCLPRTPAANLVRRAIQGTAAMVVANSRYTATNFGYRDGAPARVVYPPVALEDFQVSISRDAARRRLNIGPTTKVLAVVAQITPWKGQETAVRALALLRTREPEAELLLVGSPKFDSNAGRYDTRAYLQHLRTLTIELGIEHAVRFLGERTDVPEVLHAADLVLVPSWEEPFGLVVVEAMVAGRPVVATAHGGPAEIITHLETGILAEPDRPEPWAEAAASLLGDVDERRAMSERARLVALKFAPHRFAREMATAYREALEHIPA